MFMNKAMTAHIICAVAAVYLLAAKAYKPFAVYLTIYIAVALLMANVDKIHNTSAMLLIVSLSYFVQKLVVLLMMIVGQVPWKPLGIILGIVAITGSIGYSTLKFSSEETIQSLSELPMLHRLPTWAHRLNNHSEFPENPDSFDLATNPQITQAHVAIATCNIIGKGPGNSTVRDFLPQAYSDFIYAIIIEELGLWGGTLVLLMYLILLYRAARIASRCEKNFPAFLIMGLALLIATQAMINMSVAVGLAPVTGQPLPLVSRGGSSILMNCAYLGMMLSISRTARQRADDSQPVPSTPKQ